MSNFPKCCTFVHPLYGRLNHPRFFIIVHWCCPWTTSLSSIHGQRPRTTLLSSKGDLVSYKPHSRSRTSLSLLGWFLIPSALLDMDDPYGRIGDELISRYPINYKIKFSTPKFMYFKTYGSSYFEGSFLNAVWRVLWF